MTAPQGQEILDEETVEKGCGVGLVLRSGEHYFLYHFILPL